jgi:hypothetical protein
MTHRPARTRPIRRTTVRRVIYEQLDDDDRDVLLLLGARRAANKLRVPEEMATDLSRLVAGRDFLAHHSYRFYLSARGTRGDKVVREYLEWFHGLSAALGYGYNGLMSIVAALQEPANSELDDEALLRLWREHVSEPVPGFTPPDPRLAQDGST